MPKVKVHDLEQKCKSHSEHFQQLSKELLNFRLQSESVNILKINTTRIPDSQIPSSPQKKLLKAAVGFEAPPETGVCHLTAKVYMPNHNNGRLKVLYILR